MCSNLKSDLLYYTITSICNLFVYDILYIEKIHQGIYVMRNYLWKIHFIDMT